MSKLHHYFELNHFYLVCQLLQKLHRFEFHPCLHCSDESDPVRPNGDAEVLGHDFIAFFVLNDLAQRPSCL